MVWDVFATCHISEHVLRAGNAQASAINRSVRRAMDWQVDAVCRNPNT